MLLSPKTVSGTASFSGAVLLAAIALAGCGSSGGGSGTTKTSVPISLTSNAIVGGALPARYTCDGANTSPPLKWGGVPSSTKEVVVFAIGKPAETASHGTTTIEWSLAGVNASLHELPAGKVPPGAYLEEASDHKRHYSICPAKGQTRVYAFAIYAVPPRVVVTRNVNGITLFHNLAEGPPEFRATGSGSLTASYSRE